MGRPETISCERCSAVVAVKPRGPVPSFCADCRRTSRTTPTARPAHISCELCGAQVTVKSRGPLPTTCRGECATIEADEVAHPRADTPPAPPVTPADSPAATPPVQRPWDRGRDKTAAATRPVTVAPARTMVRSTPVLSGAAVTRIDTGPVTILRTEDLGRRFKAQQLRHAAAIALWLTVIALIALVVFVGSQPAAPNF